MNIPRPTHNSYTIYIKSGCVYCANAKALLQNERPQPLVVNCDDYLAYNKQAFLNQMQVFIGYEYRTFPMIFKNGEFIGGYTETKKSYDSKQSASCNMC